MPTITILSLSLILVPGHLLSAPPGVGSASVASDPAVDVHYEAPPACPTLDAYLAHVETRLGPGWKAAVGQFAQRVDVKIVRAGESYRGSIEFVNAQGERFARSVSGEVCAEVVDGIGLMTELAVNSGVSEPSTHASGAAPGETQPAEKSAAVHPASAVRMVKGRARSRAEAARDSKLHVRLGVRGSLTTGVGPDVAFGPGAFAALELGRGRLGLGFDALQSGEVQAGVFEADFRLLSGRFEGCPWSFELQSWATLEPCAFGELGSFRAAPRLDPPSVTVSEPQSVLWSALGVLGRLVLRRPPLFAELEIVGRTPLRRERFFVETEDRVVFRIPSASVGAALGVGLRF